MALNLALRVRTYSLESEMSNFPSHKNTENFYENNRKRLSNMSKYPGVYADVAFYRSWIDSQMKSRLVGLEELNNYYSLFI